MRLHALALLVVGAAAIFAADTWTLVSEFPAQRIHAMGNTLVAWDQQRVAVSVDGGYSWSQALTPRSQSAQQQPAIVTATVTTQGPIAILTNGEAFSVSPNGLIPAGLPPISSIEIAGDGTAFLETLNGTVLRMVGGVAAPVVQGRLYRAVARGVLIQTGEATLTFCDASGATKPVRFSGRQLPPVFQLAAPTGVGTDKWIAKNGTLWVYRDDKLLDLNRRPVEAMNYFTSGDGYQEFILYQGQQQITWEPKGGFQVHRHSQGLPQSTQRVAAGSNSYVAVGPSGIWAIDIERRR